MSPQMRDVRCPAGKARVLVRGFAASMDASAHRLNAIAADRAAIMATTIHKSWREEGNPPAASIAPQRANGQCEDRVLPLDHLQRYAQVVKNGHEKIVIQGLRSLVLDGPLKEETEDLTANTYSPFPDTNGTNRHSSAQGDFGSPFSMRMSCSCWESSRANRNDHAAALSQLRKQRARHFRGRGRNDDRIIGRIFWIPLAAVPHNHFCVAVSHAEQQHSGRSASTAWRSTDTTCATSSASNAVK